MKVLIIRNRYTKKLDWKKGVQYFDEKTPLKLEITETKTDFDFTFRTVGNATYSGVVVGGDYYQKLRSVVPEGVYDVVCLIYGNKAPGIRMNITENEFLYQNTAVIQVIKDSDGGLSFNHELFHVFFKKLARRGIVLHDPMDITFIKGEPKPYYNNKSLTAKESNRTIALQALAPYWKEVESMETKPTVTITRDKDDGIQALGTLTMNGFICKTLERPWKNNQTNISCIPKGTYEVVWSFSPKFAKYTYEIKNVSGRTGIRIHPANFFFSLQGCIALGDSYSDINSDGKVDIINSTKTLEKFVLLLNKQPFKLIIK